MPGESGLVFLTKVKEKFPHIPIIIMTAYSDLRHCVASLKKGHLNILPSPLMLTKSLKLFIRH